MELTIKLTDEQIQRSLMYLGKAPYQDIADVIDSIKNQANEQLRKETNSQIEDTAR